MMGVSNRAPVIQARSFGCLLYWHNGGCFETLGATESVEGVELVSVCVCVCVCVCGVCVCVCVCARACVRT